MFKTSILPHEIAQLVDTVLSTARWGASGRVRKAILEDAQAVVIASEFKATSTSELRPPSRVLLIRMRGILVILVLMTTTVAMVRMMMATMMESFPRILILLVSS